MRTFVALILLIAPAVSAHGQIPPQDGIIVFYTNETLAGSAKPPVVYSKNRRLGEVAKGRLIRIVVSPGTYTFALTENAASSNELSVRIRSGQEMYFQVTP